MPKAQRPAILPSATTRIDTPCGHLYVTVSTQDGAVFEVFAHLGKAGGCAAIQLEALTRSVTLGLRYGVPVADFVRQLEKIPCPSSGGLLRSCPDAAAHVLREAEEQTARKHGNTKIVKEG